jgi:pyrroloquinoline quinone biosynthesis protein E
VCAKSARHGDLQTIVVHAQRAQAEDPWQPAQAIVFRSDASSRKAEAVGAVTRDRKA